MKNYEYNWATAEIMKMYLKNSRAQDAQKARTVTEVSIDTQDALTTGSSGLATADNNAGTSHSNVDSDSESSDEDE
jgi:hypothetical protein